MLFSPEFQESQPLTRRVPAREGPAPAVLLAGEARARATYRGILVAGRFDVYEADDGDEALRLARLVRPGLILVDLGLRAGSGWELNRRLKSDPETYLIPVVATSLAAVPGGTYRRVRSAGFVDLITRPIERRHVLELAHTWAGPIPEPAA